MGSNDTSSQKTVHTGMADHGYSPVQPVHQVTISYGFYMGKYEVTQAQWMRVMRTPNPSTFKCPNCPVDRVSFWDVANFLKKLNAMNDGYKYRLPSESEWEYACRAGTTGDYHDSDLDKIAWYSANSGKKTHPVGGKRPNAFGLYDMLGNAAEWCADYWHNDYVGAPADGSAWITGGDRGWRVFRGGGWSFNASDLRSATRYSEVPNYSSVGPGFRIVAIAQTK